MMGVDNSIDELIKSCFKIEEYRNNYILLFPKEKQVQKRTILSRAAELISCCSAYFYAYFYFTLSYFQVSILFPVGVRAFLLLLPLQKPVNHSSCIEKDGNDNGREEGCHEPGGRLGALEKG